MLMRLKVDGFKNLTNVDVSFGAFTCIAGGNGVGKSNLFDAITFLSSLATDSLVDAAKSVRDVNHRSTDISSLFRQANGETQPNMRFEAEMVVPARGRDDLGQLAVATITSLVYVLELAFLPASHHTTGSRLRIVREELSPLKKGDATKHLVFPNSPAWRNSIVQGKGRRNAVFISMDDDQDVRRVQFHQDRGSGGKPRKFAADDLPRTVISTATADESPTALLAKQEMQSWRLLQLEPSALRMPDGFDSPARIDASGAHLAATLRRLAGRDTETQAQVCAQVASRVSELVETIRSVSVDVNQQRELLSIKVVERSGTEHFAKALSDGTLRFLALAIMELDSEAQGLLCFEEPENGIHPERIPAMIRLLTDLAVDPQEPVGNDNPLRQVIVNTHSPSVVSLIDDADLLLARPAQAIVQDQRCDTVQFCALEGTWRVTKRRADAISKGELQAFLNPAIRFQDVSDTTGNGSHGASRPRVRVIDRDDMQSLLPFMETTGG